MGKKITADSNYEKTSLITDSVNKLLRLIVSTIREDSDSKDMQICENSFMSLQLAQSSLLCLKSNEEIEFYLLVLNDLLNSYSLRKTNESSSSVMTYRIMRYCEELLKFIFTEDGYVRWSLSSKVERLDSIILATDLIKSCLKERRKLDIKENEKEYIDAFINLFLYGINDQHIGYMKHLMLTIINAE